MESNNRKTPTRQAAQSGRDKAPPPPDYLNVAGILKVLLLHLGYIDKGVVGCWLLVVVTCQLTYNPIKHKTS